MAVVAKISTTWKKRFYLLVGFMAATALWFLYDGAIRYPELNRAHDHYKQMESEGRADEWLKVSAERGWPAKAPKEPYDVGQQYFFGGIAGGIALGLAIWVVISVRRTVRSDDDAIYGSTGKRVAFGDVRKIDMKKWDSKGIAVLHYEQDGQPGKMIVDDYKYEGAAVILDEIKAYQQARKEPSGMSP